MFVFKGMNDRDSCVKRRTKRTVVVIYLWMACFWLLRAGACRSTVLYGNVERRS